MRRLILAALAALAALALVAVSIAPADSAPAAPERPAHFMVAGQTTTDGFRGECFVETEYVTFGQGVAQVKIRPGEGGSCSLNSDVTVTTAYQGGVRSRLCSLANAVDGASGCVLKSINPIIWWAVAPGEAFQERTAIRTVDGRQSIETHGAFG